MSDATNTITVEAPAVAPAKPVFRMPVPQIGQPVMWFKNGSRSGQFEIKFVEKITPKSICVNGGWVNVPHVSDPRLQQNAFQRENGAWEFTPFQKEIDAKIAAVEARAEQLEKLTQDLTKLINDKKK